MKNKQNKISRYESSSTK